MDQGHRMLLGEILLARKCVTKEQVRHALDFQKKENGFIGEILVKLGYLEERDIVVALVIQCGLPYIAINKYEIDAAMISLIPEEIARQERVIALDRIGDVLSVVMANPLTPEKKQLLEQITSCRVAVFISTKTEIDQAIERHYRKK